MKLKLIECVNQKGILALVSTWGTAIWLGSEWGAVLATIATVLAYLSDSEFLLNNHRRAQWLAIGCFLSVISSLVLSILRII